MTEFLVVGRGLAASVLMHAFYQHRISFKTIGNPELSSCSAVAAGIWNPVVFKRLTKSWLADDLVPHLNQFYSDCENLLNKKLLTQRPIIKPFTEDQEKKLWLKKAGGELNGFLDPVLQEQIPETLQNLNIHNGFGTVNHCGNLDVREFLNATAQAFSEHVIHDTFDHQALQVFPDKVVYRHVEARCIIFCEGHLVSNNPFFSWIPLKPAKGEVLTIQSDELHLHQQIFNRNGFLMDVQPGTYRVGATYEWNDLTEQPTAAGLQELSGKLRDMSPCSYSILRHEAGIRPSSIDRRPIIGRHPVHSNLFVFNGLGTKGVMLAPFFAKKVVHFYVQNQSLHDDVNVSRFYHLYAEHKK